MLSVHRDLSKIIDDVQSVMHAIDYSLALTGRLMGQLSVHDWQCLHLLGYALSRNDAQLNLFFYSVLW